MAETSVVCAATTTRLKQLEEIQILLEQCLQRDAKVVFGLNPQQLTDWDNARIKLLQTLHSKSVDCKSQAFDGYFIGTFFNEARFIAEEEAILVFHANAQSSPTAAITA
jgi:hypothetical protein